MKLIITEKKSTSKLIAQALVKENDVIFAEIGGHIYTEDESKYMQVSKEELDAAKTIKLPNSETGYVLGEEYINRNIEHIKELLTENAIDSIINACEPDKNGEALFNYANSLIGFNTYKVRRLELLNMSEEHIKEQYALLFQLARKE